MSEPYPNLQPLGKFHPLSSEPAPQCCRPPRPRRSPCPCTSSLCARTARRSSGTSWCRRGSSSRTRVRRVRKMSFHDRPKLNHGRPGRSQYSTMSTAMTSNRRCTKNALFSPHLEDMRTCITRKCSCYYYVIQKTQCTSNYSHCVSELS